MASAAGDSRKRSIPEEEASAAAAGWRGDRLAFYLAGRDDYSYLWRIRFDSSETAGVFAAALDKARRGRAGAPRIWRAGSDVVVSLGFAELPALPGLATEVGAPKS